MGQKLHVIHFRQLYQRLQTEVVWLDHLILGLLVWLEARYIDIKAESAVDQALKEFNPDIDDCSSPVYQEQPSEGSTSLPEMRLRAHWYKEED